MSQLAIAVDLGGTKIATAHVDSTGVLLTERSKTPTPNRAGSEAVLDAIAAAIEAQRGLITDAKLAAIGVGAAGAVDTARGAIVSAADTVVGWQGTNVAAGLRARLPWAADLPIQVQNDVDAHAVGESWRGAGAGAASMLLVAVGTGIGAAFCVDGKVWRGAHHMAGEVGQMRIGTANFEQQAAGPAIVENYHRAGGHSAATRGQDVMELARAGDSLANSVIEMLGRRVGRTLSWLVLTLDPEVVVLGGGVPSPKSGWWTAMETELRMNLPEVVREVPVKRAQLRNNAALLGAARDAFRLAGVETY